MYANLVKVNQVYLEEVSEKQKIQQEFEDMKQLNMELLKKFQEQSQHEEEAQQSFELENPLDLNTSLMLSNL